MALAKLCADRQTGGSRDGDDPTPRLSSTFRRRGPGDATSSTYAGGHVDCIPRAVRDSIRGVRVWRRFAAAIGARTVNVSLQLLCQNLAAITSLLFGLLALWRPRRIANTVSFDLRGARGRAELRIGFGGFMIGLAGFVLWSQHPHAFMALGFLWLGGAVSRVLVWLIDQPVLDRSYLLIFVYELAHAALLLWGGLDTL